jgi:hypothetical protein
MHTRASRLQPAQQSPRESRHLLDRILDTPRLAEAVPKLPPEFLHRLIEHCGLEACGELVSLTTPAQLTQILDLDLWRSAQAGRDERFDADRFGEWIDVLVDAGPDVAAARLATMDIALVVTGLAQHVRVFDRGATSTFTTLEGIQVTPISRLEDEVTREIGGYLLVALGGDMPESIVEALIALESRYGELFHRVKEGCRGLSDGGHEIDELEPVLGVSDQAMFELELDREQRRESRGYMTPPQARAFLQSARHGQRGAGSSPPEQPIARAYFQAIEDVASEGASLEAESSADSEVTVGADAAAAVAAVVDLLADAGVLQRPRALLGSAAAPESRVAAIEAQLKAVFDHDAAAGAMRDRELAFLANVLTAGCSIQTRPFSRQEAFDAVLATCNLGLENWPAEWASDGRVCPDRDAVVRLPGDFLVATDLITVFQVGWTVLHERVSMDAAARLIDALSTLRCADPEIQRDLTMLRMQMTRAWRAGMPWQAREALDVITNLDLPAWAGLLALTDECPTLHGAVVASETAALSVAPDAFEFISENRQIARMRAFLAALPARLA